MEVNKLLIFIAFHFIAMLFTEEFGRGQSMFDFPCCAKQVDDEDVVDKECGHFKRSHSIGQASLRASTRGEYSSSILQRSIRSRSSFKSINTKL